MKTIIIVLSIMLFLLHSLPIIMYTMCGNNNCFIFYIGLGILDILLGVFIDENKKDIT